MTQSTPSPGAEDGQAPTELFYRLASEGDAEGLLSILPLFVGTSLFAGGFSRAALQGHLASVELFLPHASKDQLATAAFHAAKGGRGACLARLAGILAQTNDAAPLALNAGEDSAMGIAAARGHAECVAILLSLAEAGQSKSGLAPSGVARALMPMRGDALVSQDDALAKVAFRGLRAACLEGRHACVKLLSPLCSPTKNATALIAAAKGGHVECVRLLAERAELSLSYLSFALESAAEHGYFECVDILWPMVLRIPAHPTLFELAADARLRGFHAAATLMEALSERDALSELPPLPARGPQRI